MDDKTYSLERQHLRGILEFLKQEINSITNLLSEHKDTLLEIRKEMWDEGMMILDDTERNIEINQYINMEAIETSKYKNKLENLVKYQSIRNAPYFGRVDFKEDGEDTEQVYIGYHNVMNDDTFDVLIYDWRAPISSVFYNADLGKVSYEAPCGEINGNILLKRQFQIEKGELHYYFDSNTTITDSILKDALGQNVSHKMRNIVETIQQEQNSIIRNKKNDLLIVQGVAGSGKTSIAMHRIAFLLYNQRKDGLDHNDVIIISPNSLFGDYISGILPELGERNVRSNTLGDLYNLEFKSEMHTKNNQFELILSSSKRDQIRKEIEFKGSFDFIKILNQYLEWIEEYGMPFGDITYNGHLIMEEDEMVAHFMDNQIGMVVAKRLSRIERIILERIKPFEAELKAEIEHQLIEQGGYDYQEESEAQKRIDGIRGNFISNISKYTRNNYIGIYINFLKDVDKIKEYAKGITLPDNLENICQRTISRLNNGLVRYEDGSILLYIKLKLEGSTHYSNYKQVVIDEAQDYYPIHYYIFKAMFNNCHYTILGDYGQSIEKASTAEVYDDAIKILQPKNPLRLDLVKSYRSSYEINQLTAKLRGNQELTLAFERHEEESHKFWGIIKKKLYKKS